MPISFQPICNQNTRLLVLGSMPGATSLRAQEYYAYPQNQFWQIIFELFAGGRPPEDYQNKLQTLLQNGIGLWDTLATCERPDSLDSSIRAAEPNDFPALFSRYPQIKTLLFNGQTSYEYFRHFFGLTPGFTLCAMPSTSPAHASLSYGKKLEIWRNAFSQGLNRCL